MSPRSFTPRSPLPLPARLQKLHKSLVDQVNESYFDNAIKTCKKILTLDSSSQTAFQTHLYLLLQLDRYADALKLISTASPSRSLEFERAYCLYRLHKEDEALDVIAKLRSTQEDLALEKEDGMGRKLTSLEGQICYRIGKYDRAEELFTSLQSTCPKNSPEYADLIHNLSATRSNRSFTTSEYNTYLPSSSSTLESAVPSFPVAIAGSSKVLMPSGSTTTKMTATDQKKEMKKGKPKHKLPKGAVLGSKFEEDPDRWLPLKQRASYISSTVSTRRKKGGKKEGMGTGMTQGTAGEGGSGASTPVGKGGKKGKKGR